MKKHSPVLVTLFALLAVCGAWMAYAGVAGDESMLAVGVIADAILSLAALVYHRRSLKLKRITQQEGHLLRFEYAAEEAEAIIAHTLPSVRKAGSAIGILLSVCLIIIFLPFVQIALDADVHSPILLYAIPAALLPLLAIFLAPAAAAAKIRRYPCVTVIGQNYVLIANRYPGINDYQKLALKHAELLPEAKDGLRYLRAHYSYRAMRNPTTIRKTVDIPVPRGKEREAEEFARAYQGNKRAPK